jgi:hypothetical protein
VSSSLTRELDPCMTVADHVLTRWYSFAGGIVVIEPMINIYTKSIWSTWHKTLDAQKPEELRHMSEKIWENTLRPASALLNKDTLPREFCTNVSGASLRWEVLGIVVSLVSLLAQSLKGKICGYMCSPGPRPTIDAQSDGDPVFCSHDQAPVDRASLALNMHNASEMCVSFCDELGALNDLYLWLLYENSIAYCSIRTRGSKFMHIATSFTVAKDFVFLNSRETMADIAARL